MILTGVSEPIHHDFFSAEGTDIPPDAVLEFDTAAGTVPLRPDFVRPHLTLLARLPSSIPAGAVQVRLRKSSGTSSNALPVTVAGGSAKTVHVLQSGDAKQRPYTIAFVANPAIESAAGASFTADPVLTNRPGYHDAVRHSFENLFSVAEDLLRQNAFDQKVRVVSIFDVGRPSNTANALAHEVPFSSTMEPRRSVLAAFLSSVGVVADMVFVFHGSTTHTRASAWFTTDDAALPGTAFLFDGTVRTHGHFPRIPGSAAVPVSLDQSGLTILHEFLHASSDFTNGKVVDLYNDSGDGAGFLVNKKFRSAATDPVPASFASFNGNGFAADGARDGLGYPTHWRSYHPAPIDGTRPNVMDNYWEAPDDPQLCRVDRLTYDWLRDRLNAKLSR